MARWGGQQHRAAGRLVDAARLEADEAVLHQVHASDAVRAAELVEPGEEGRRRERRAVHRHRVAGLEGDLHHGGGIGGIFGRNRAGVDVGGRLGRGVFERLALA